MFEFAILSSTGRPEIVLPIDVDDFVELTSKAAALGLQTFNRFYDYYTDAEIPAEDIDRFISDLDLLLQSLEHDDHLANFLKQLRSISVDAKIRLQPLYGLAD